MVFCRQEKNLKLPADKPCIGSGKSNGKNIRDELFNHMERDNLSHGKE